MVTRGAREPLGNLPLEEEKSNGAKAGFPPVTFIAMNDFRRFTPIPDPQLAALVERARVFVENNQALVNECRRLQPGQRRDPIAGVSSSDIPLLRNNWVAARDFLRQAHSKLERLKPDESDDYREVLVGDKEIARGVMFMMANLRLQTREVPAIQR